MGKLRALLLLISASALQLAGTSPVPVAAPDPLTKCGDQASNTDHLTKKGVNCLIAQDPDCWHVLKMEDWVRAWLKGPKGELCGTQGIAEGFGDCFIDLYKITPRCSSITVAACGTGIISMVNDLTESDTVGGPISCFEQRQVFFAATNIVSMSNFLNSWYEASNKAAQTTSTQITDIVNVASPPPEPKKDIWKALVLDSLLAGLAFAPGLSQAKTLFSSGARLAKMAGEGPVRMLLSASAPATAHLFPNDGSASSNLIDIATLQNDLNNFVDDLQARLQPTLETVINNVEEFLNWADTGIFSSPDPPKLPEQVEGLQQALTTYIVSVALTSANWNAVVSPATDVNALLSGQLGHQNIDYGCSAVDAVTKQCNAIWQDVPNNQGFTMVQSTSILNNPYDKFQEYFGNVKHDPYTTPEMLFVGAARCRQRPGWGQGVGVIIENGEINFDCLSQMKVCTYKQECTMQDESCKYLEEDCSPEQGWGYDRDRCKGNPVGEADSANTFQVEPGYMGPMRTQGGLQYKLAKDSQC